MSDRRIEERLARRGGAVELLRVPALAFGAAARLRGWLYDRRVLPVQQVAAPVVSVGNLTAGGTGKTPMVAWLVRWFEAQGLRAGIASRGYGARSGPDPASGYAPNTGAGEPNDEARMLGELLPGVPHEQDADRVAAAQRLVDQGVDVIVLDDGFQHRRLHRDLDIVLVDASRPWGLRAPEGGAAAVRAFLPRGLLREAPRALARAHAVVLTRCDQATGSLEALEGELAALAPGAALARTQHAPSAVRDPEGTRRPLEDLHAEGLPWALVSGIGNPGAFEATVRALGLQPQEHRVRKDHHDWAMGDLKGLEGLRLLTTAKDAPKLRALRRDFWTLEVELSFDKGEDALTRQLAELPPGARRNERAALHEGLHG